MAGDENQRRFPATDRARTHSPAPRAPSAGAAGGRRAAAKELGKEEGLHDARRRARLPHGPRGADQRRPFTRELREDRELVAGTLLPIASARPVRGTTVIVSPDGKHLLFAGGAFRLPAEKR